MAVAESFGVLNYSGMLFNKGNVKTPLSTLIGGRQKLTNHVEFAIGQEYNTDTVLAQPAISEDDSLTAPTPTVKTRTQKTNVTQIFHKSVGISYAKESNMGTLSGLNVANQTANPMNELDFQVACKMQEIANEIEYTFINGVYQKATSDAMANKTCGLLAAIGAGSESSHAIAMSNKALGLWDVAEAMKVIFDDNAPTSDLTLCCDAITKFQINADAVQNGLTVVPAARNINGIAVDEVITPLGTVRIALFEHLPAGTAMLLNLGVISPVGQPVPKKGNFFMEELAKTGAGKTYQIFGQMGLDYGASWYHAKFTGIATTFTKPTYSRSVYVANAADFA